MPKIFFTFKIGIFLLIRGVSILTCLKCTEKIAKGGYKLISHKIREKRKKENSFPWQGSNPQPHAPKTSALTITPQNR